MNKNISINENIAHGHKISRKGRLTLTSLDFLFVRGFAILQGVPHSSSLPDYIEDRKSGGQQTNCLLKNLCYDSTINTGLADRGIKQMPKTVMRG